MTLWNDNRIYIWMQFSRVTGKAGGDKFYAYTGTDSETTGRFNDSVTRVGFATVFPGQCESEVFLKYKDVAVDEASSQGFSSMQILKINRSDYDTFAKAVAIEAEKFESAFYAPAYTGTRLVKR